MALKSKKKLVVAEPKVFVIGVQKVNRRGLLSFLKSEGHGTWSTTAEQASEIIPEVAGRLCYMSFGGGREHSEYVDHIKASRHGSVLEHAVVTFILTGVSRSFTHECIRHRAGWAYSQLSQRYVDESNCQFVIPWAVARKPKLRRTWTRMVAAQHAMYRQLKAELEASYSVLGRLSTLLRKVINGAARSLLPNACETKICCTVNARALRHFLEMRASEAADHEIRLVAMSIYHAVLPLMPNILSDYVVQTDADGVEYLTTTHVKV